MRKYPRFLIKVFVKAGFLLAWHFAPVAVLLFVLTPVLQGLRPPFEAFRFREPGYAPTPLSAQHLPSRTVAIPYRPHLMLQRRKPPTRH